MHAFFICFYLPFVFYVSLLGIIKCVLLNVHGQACLLCTQCISRNDRYYSTIQSISQSIIILIPSSSISSHRIRKKSLDRKKNNLQNIFIKSRQNILLRRPSDLLQSLMRLALLVVELHILHRRKRRLHGNVEALVADIGEGDSYGCGRDVGFSVLVVVIID